MKNAVSHWVLMLALAATGGAHAATNFEYNNPSPFDPTKPAQPNLAQIGVTPSLHTSVSSYLAGSPWNTSVTIAILDGYADTRHVDLTGRETSKIVYKGVYTRYDSHATHVSGIIGASRNNIGIVGVDPFSTLINIPVFDQKGWVATDLGKAALDAAKTAGARVVNMSYGPTTKGDVFLTGELNLFKTYNSSTAGQGMVLVRAAGNDGVNAINEAYTGNASVDLGNLLIVGSVGVNNVISSFSNRPGAACIGSCGTNNVNAMMNFWLVAPGENILSDLPNNYVGTMSGTSMAAPHVAGAAGLVFQYALAGNTKLTPAQVAGILKQSARDLGAAGIDPVYGWGLLDVAAALQPVGPLSVTTSGTVSGGTTPLGGSGMTLSSLTQNAKGMEMALSGMIVLDSYQRAFVLDAPKLTTPASVTTQDPLQSLFGLISASETDLGGGGEFSVSLIGGGAGGGGRFDVVSFNGSQFHLDVGRGTSIGYFTRASAAADTQPRFSRTMGDNFFTGSDALTSPFGQAMFVGADFAASDDLTVSSLFVQSTPYNALYQVPDNIAAFALRNQPISSLVKLGANQRLGKSFSVGVSYGLLSEVGQTLGMRMSGAFSLGDVSFTHIGDVNLNARLSADTSVSLFAEQAITSLSGAEGSLFRAGGTWGSSKYGIGFTRSGLFAAGDLVQLKVTRSLQIDSGALALHVPVGRELDGTVNYEDRYVPLGLGQNPMEVGFAYLGGTRTFSYGTQLSVKEDRFSGGRLSELTAVGAMRWSF